MFRLVSKNLGRWVWARTLRVYKVFTKTGQGPWLRGTLPWARWYNKLHSTIYIVLSEFVSWSAWLQQWLIINKTLLLTVLEGGSQKSGCQHYGVLVKDPSGLCIVSFSLDLPMVDGARELFQKSTNPINKSSTLMMSAPSKSHTCSYHHIGH